VSSASTVPNNNADQASHLLRPTTPGPLASKAVMGIFAGAPRSTGPDPWVVVSPKATRGARVPNDYNSATLTRSSLKRGANKRLSRNVDAVIDTESIIGDSDIDEQDEAEASDFRSTLLERTLRPRGLSDSSIHSTFMNAEADANEALRASQAPALPPHAMLHGGQSTRQGAFPGVPFGRQSVLQSLSRKVHSFKSAGPSAPASDISASPPTSGSRIDQASRAVSPRRIDILPSFASWAAARAGLDADETEHFVGSVREEGHFTHRNFQRDVAGKDI